MMKKQNLILFDYDGVLVDSLVHNVAIAEDCARKMGLDTFPSVDEIRNMDNMTFEETGLLMGFSEEENRIFLKDVFKGLTAGVDRLSIFPGMGPLIRSLSKNHIVTVLTANTEQGVSRFLEINGLSEYVAAVLGSGTPGAKSDKTKALMKRFSMDRDQVYLIGDTISDIREAKRAGVKSIAVTWGFQDKNRLLKEQPDFMVNRPQEIGMLFGGNHHDG